VCQLDQRSLQPNFLFLGPDKAGSTWLYTALQSHSQVYLPAVKELFFFDRFYEKGWQWYSGYFKDAREGRRVIGEICHDYLFSTLACQRIAHDLPNVKLMVCLREPCQRAFSEYLYQVKVGLLACKFEAALKQVDGLIDRGRYAKHLSCYLQAFHRRQIFVAIFDDLIADPQKFFDNVCDFLGIDHVCLSDQLKQKVLPAARPRSRHLAKLMRSAGWGLRQLGFPRIVGKFKDSALLSKIMYSPYLPNQKPEISPDTQRYLREIYAPEVRQLDELIEAQLSHRWGYSPDVQCERLFASV